VDTAAVDRRHTVADAEGLITWDANVDSTVCGAHRHAAGAVKRGASGGSRQAASSVFPEERDLR
jgi:hypothetical protein